MDKNKKTRFLVRILCGILAVIMTLSVIMPVVYATEIDESVVNSAPYRNGDGFEYIEMDGEWCLNATSENPVFRLVNVDEAFTRDNFPLIICNIDTYEVIDLNLLEIFGYASSTELKEGYYFAVANNYCWEDENDNTWAINGGETFYFYYGNVNNFQENKYGLNYVVFNNRIIDIPLMPYVGTSLPRISHRQTFHIDVADKVYPIDELHNIDEMLERLEYLDLDASLESGHPVYQEGYETNVTTGANMDGNISDAPNVDLSELAQSTGASSVTPNLLPSYTSDTTTGNSDAPIAQPEVIVTTPATPSTTPNSQPPMVGTEGQGTTSEEQKEIPNALDVATDILKDKTGIEIEKPPTVKESLLSLLKSTLLFGALFAIAFFAYIKLKQKQEFAREESLEYDKYDEGRIE